jgi:hypothetical protein
MPDPIIHSLSSAVLTGVPLLSHSKKRPFPIGFFRLDQAPRSSNPISPFIPLDGFPFSITTASFSTRRRPSFASSIGHFRERHCRRRLRMRSREWTSS